MPGTACCAPTKRSEITQERRRQGHREAWRTEKQRQDAGLKPGATKAREATGTAPHKKKTRPAEGGRYD